MRIEFIITRTRAGFVLEADGVVVDTFASDTAAADMAVRFAQDAGAAGYRIIY
ncbi:MAG: hypothetical protein ACK53W_12490 [Gemmatimonadota bacterium]